MSQAGHGTHDPMIGRTVLGRHRVVRALAKGGMGVVYLARSEGASGFTKPVVVKRMASDLMVDDSMSRMFVREARLMSRLRHPGLVQVIDFGEEHGDYLMVIEYVHGFHLGQWNRYHKLRRGSFPCEDLLHVMAQILDSLHYAHTLKDSQGRDLQIVHRDVSPSNILVDVDGQVKLADFGVARSRDQTEQTDQSTIKGKMPYLSPELFRLEQPSANSDTYACAVVLHELLTGRNEFRGPDVATTVSRVLEHVPTPIDAVRDDLPEGLGDIVARALDKDMERRFQTAMELAKALRSVRTLPEDAAAQDLRERAQTDFTDPTFADAVHFVSLAAREHAWQHPPGKILPSVPPVVHARLVRHSSSPPTLVEKLDGEDEEKVRRHPWRLALGALLVALAAAGGAIALMGRGAKPGDHSDRVYMVVNAAGREDDAGETVGGDVDAAGTVAHADDAGMSSQARAPDRGHDRRAPAGHSASARSLAGAFQRRRASVRACFRAHVTGDSPDSIEIRFTVAADGHVEAAGISPESVSSTALGQCVIRVARETRFPRQSHSVRFRIPVRVRSGE